METCSFIFDKLNFHQSILRVKRTLILSLSSLWLVSVLSLKAQQHLYTPRQDSTSVERVISSLSVQFLGAAVQQERRIATYTTVIYGLGIFGSKISANPPNFQTRFIASKDIP